MVGSAGKVLDWRAEDRPGPAARRDLAGTRARGLEPGRTVRVKAIEGLTVEVEPEP